MTLDNHEETVEPVEGDEDSGVIKGLRSQVKDLKAQNKTLESVSAELAELKQEKATNQLVGKGFSEDQASIMLDRLDGAEVTEEVISQYHAVFNIPAEGEEEGSGGAPASENEGDDSLADVASLAGQVAAASEGGDKGWNARVNEAETTDEIISLLGEIAPQ